MDDLYIIYLMLLAVIAASFLLRMLFSRIISKESTTLPVAGLVLCGVIYWYFLLLITLSN